MKLLFVKPEDKFDLKNVVELTKLYNDELKNNGVIGEFMFIPIPPGIDILSSDENILNIAQLDVDNAADFYEHISKLLKEGIGKSFEVIGG